MAIVTLNTNTETAKGCAYTISLGREKPSTVTLLELQQAKLYKVQAQIDKIKIATFRICRSFPFNAQEQREIRAAQATNSISKLTETIANITRRRYEAAHADDIPVPLAIVKQAIEKKMETTADLEKLSRTAVMLEQDANVFKANVFKKGGAR